MSGDDVLELRARPLPDGSGWEILSPGVGYFAQAPELGARRGPREQAGVLLVLERPLRLVLPEGVAGSVASTPPERTHLPVGYGTPLFVLRAEAGPAGVPAAAASRGGTAAVAPERKVVTAPQAGRFWRRPEPKAPPYVQDGDELTEGRTLGLLEVMKTFNPVKYAAGGHLPARARVRRFLAADGGEVAEGQPLLELD